jgi:DNA-binding MarR family transcriptional regulator
LKTQQTARKKPAERSGASRRAAETVWRPEADIVRHLVLAAILKDNPIPVAYRLNYVANFYVGPLIKKMERQYRMSRPEWIVLFCLNQQPNLNAQKISQVTGRPKTSISTAVKQLQRKKLIVRHADAKDARHQVLRTTDAGQKAYKSILRAFVAREADMLACLEPGEQKVLMGILDKMIQKGSHWARPY